MLNSLKDNILDESFRVPANRRVVIEIGEKLKLDRNQLAMEPFGSNMSFMVVDMFHQSASDELISRNCLSPRSRSIPVPKHATPSGGFM